VTMSYWNRSGGKELLGPFNLTMRILIAGGFGFIGGRLANHFSQSGHQVVLGSRNESNPPVWLPKVDVAQIKWNDENALESSCEGVDVIIHAAGMNAQECSADPVAALDFNGVATARLVAASSRAGVKKFIYLSTAHVYANPLVGTITEGTCPRNLHPYATSHLSGEHTVLSASQLGKIEGIVLRLSNAFGVPMHKDVNCWMLLVNDLCKQAVQTGRLVLQTRGLQQRDFISLTDVCRVTEYFSVRHSKSKTTGVFNVGVGMSQSVLEMAQLIQKRCKSVLGFEPLLQFFQEEVNEQHPLLTYQSNNLAELGINLNGLANKAEIDGLLRFCQTVFPKY
jgi:UDP-glucose 4-epimerase